MVNRADAINARQLHVLQWIADGCPDGVMKDFTYKTTAVALQGRRLVTVTRKRGSWRAQITEAGEYYLAHGCHLDRVRTSPRIVVPARRPVTHQGKRAGLEGLVRAGCDV